MNIFEEIAAILRDALSEIVEIFDEINEAPGAAADETVPPPENRHTVPRRIAAKRRRLGARRKTASPRFHTAATGE